MMRKKNNKDMLKKEEEFEQRIVDVARVTRVMAGGKRMKFRVTLAIGDKKGRVGYGVAKGADVTLGITKALAKAKKDIVKVPLINDTIIHPVNVKYGAAKVLLKPARKGSGIKAGGAVRILCELAGIPNITAKILGTNNKLNNVKATMLAFQSFKKAKKSSSSPKGSDKTKASDDKQGKKVDNKQEGSKKETKESK